MSFQAEEDYERDDADGEGGIDWNEFFKASV